MSTNSTIFFTEPTCLSYDDFRLEVYEGKNKSTNYIQKQYKKYYQKQHFRFKYNADKLEIHKYQQTKRNVKHISPFCNYQMPTLGIEKCNMLINIMEDHEAGSHYIYPLDFSTTKLFPPNYKHKNEMHRLYQFLYNCNTSNVMGDLLGKNDGHQFNTDLFDAALTLLSPKYDMTKLDILYIGLRKDTQGGEIHKDMVLEGNPILTANIKQSSENTKYWFSHSALNNGQAFVIPSGFGYGIPMTADSYSKGHSYGINKGEFAWKIFIGGYLRYDVQDENKGLLYNLDLYGFENDGNIQENNPYYGQTLINKQRILNNPKLNKKKLKRLLGKHNREYGHRLHTLNVNNKQLAIKTARNSHAMIRYQRTRQTKDKKIKLVKKKRKYNLRPRKRIKTN